MIKFNKFNVTDTETKAKARIWYSHQRIINDARDCVTLYAKDYDKVLGEIFGIKFHDGTDMMTDYFDKGRVRIFEGDALYKAALARVAQ